MTGSAACPRDHSHLPYRFLLGVKVTCGTCRAVVSGPGWRCGSCGWTLLDTKAWSQHVGSSAHREAEVVLSLHAPPKADAFHDLIEGARMASERLKQQEEEVRTEIETRRLRQESNRLAREEEARRLNESEATQVVAATERERVAKEKRGREEKELLEREESDRRRAEVDVALISGKDPDLIPYSVRGVTAAQVRARQLELARLKENRGNPWAELALDREIDRLLSLGTKRDAIRDQLGVGEHRIARVRRRHRTGTGSAP